MLILLAILSGVALGWATGGSFLRLEHLTLRGERAAVLLLLITAVMPRVLETQISPGQYGLIRALWVLAIVALATIALANRDRPGTLSVGVGMALNATVISLNGGMPVSEDAASEIARGYSITESAFHQALSMRTVAPFLGDVLPVPGPAGLRSLVSVGDVLMLAGIAILLASSMRRRLTPL